MSTDVVPYEQRIGALSVQDVQSQVSLIQHVLKAVMQEGQHFGVIPGTGTKPTLLKAGAEKLCLTFRLDPQYDSTERYDGLHLTVKSKCTLYHIPSGQRFGSGEGSCSTRETKYAYRSSSRKCPNCGSEAIIKGKEEYGGGWLCFAKKGGCGAKFLEKDEAITTQVVGRIPNEDVADQYNTVLKMANKRSLVAAVLNATAASDIFTQDIEDMPQFAGPVLEGAIAAVSKPTDPFIRAADLTEWCEKAKVKYGDILKTAGVGDVKDMTEQDYQDALAMLKRKVKAKQEIRQEISQGAV